MRAILLTIGIIVLTILSVGAQTLTILDQTNLSPLVGVNVYNKSKSLTAVSTDQGKVDISAFKGVDSIFIQHLGYKTEVQSYRQLSQQKDNVIKLARQAYSADEVVVSANRWEQRRATIPNKVTKVGEENVHFQNPPTSADLVGLSDKVFIQKSQLGGGSPMIRGFATNRVLLVVDGVRMNNAIFRGGNLQNVISLDAHSVSNMEVIFGPGSMIYGSDAIGGVMSFQTLSPHLSLDTTVRIQGEGMIRYASDNDEMTGHLEVNIGLKEWAFLTSVSYSDYDHLRMGSHGPDTYLRQQYVDRIKGKDTVLNNPDPRVQRPSGYSQWNVMQKVKFRPNEAWKMQYGFHYSKTSNIPRYDRLIEKVNGQFRKAEWYYGPQKWMLHNLSVNHRPADAFYEKAKLNLAYQDYTESRHDRDFQSPWLRHRMENVKIPSLNLDLTSSISKNQQLFYGIEAVYNKVYSTASEENITDDQQHLIGTRYPNNSDWQSYAAYIMWKGHMGDNWTLTGGLRYNHVLVNAQLDTTYYPFPFTNINISTGAPTGNIGIVYRPGTTWRIRLNGATGFRAPNIDDAGKVFDSEPGKVIVPNPNLKAEYAYNVDLGVTKDIGHRVTAKITGFYTILTNAMVRRLAQYNGRDSIVYDGTLSRVQTLKNVGSAKIYGVQAALYADIWNGLKFEGHYNYTYGKTSDGKAVRHVAPPFGAAHLKYEKEQLKLDLYAKYNGKIPYSRLSPSERGKPHLYLSNEAGKPYSPRWYTLNFKANYQVNRYLQMQGGVENIFDRRYKRYSSGIIAPGRHYYVTLRGLF